MWCWQWWIFIILCTKKNHIKFETAFSDKKILKFTCAKLGAATILNDEE